MKKDYQKPTMKAVHVEVLNLVCATGQTNVGLVFSNDDYDGVIRSRGRRDWDDEDEE